MPSPSDSGALVRIGELSRRVGVGEHTLRAWESRYGLLRPTRSAGGYRLYSTDDERRVRQMSRLIGSGLSAAQAAEAVRRGTSPPTVPDRADPGRHGPRITEALTELADAVDHFDETAAHAVLDRLFTELAVPTVLRDVVLPYLHTLGERWQRGEASVTQEHFASNLIRGRVAALTSGWGQGLGPTVLLACPPGEQHDLPLMIFGVALHRAGWRVVYLGSDTPATALWEAVAASQPAVLVLAATTPGPFEALGAELRHLARSVDVAVAGAGATAELARSANARRLTGDPITAAWAMAAGRDTT